MKKYDIWIEGYSCTCELGTAQLIVTNIEGNSFIEAVENWWNALDDEGKRGWGGDIYIDKKDNYASIWACRLFDNEKDARESFG